ncbi:MAG: hypothetical protein RIR65_2889 [Planctomycetota bacterium]
MSDAAYRASLSAIVLAVLAWSGVAPHDRLTWLLETLPAMVGLATMLATTRRFPLSRLAWMVAAIHMVILCVGGRYTYALVPAGDWVRDWFDQSRNNYDKLGHFWQGFGPAIIARELIVRTSPLRRGGWLAFLVVCFALALSAVYELVEWAAAVVSSEAAEAFLGTQGYAFDTQSDMLWCGIGAIAALASLTRLHDRQLARMARATGAMLVAAACLCLGGCVRGDHAPEADPRAKPRLIVVGADLARADVDGAETARDLHEAVARIAGTQRPCVLELAEGVHELRSSLRIGAGHPPLVLRPRAGSKPGATRLRGALALGAERWREPDAELQGRLPARARGRARQACLTLSELDGWRGGLSGPVHGGHGVAVEAIHSEVLARDGAMSLAAWPDRGHAPIHELIDAGSAPRLAEADIPAADRKVEAPRPGRFRHGDRAQAARWAVEEDAWAHGYWNWDWSDEQLRIAAVDEAGVVALDRPHRYGVAARARWRIVNALGELDAPGEAWIDARGARLVAWFADDAPPEAAVTLLAEPLVVLEGAAQVRLEGLVFSATRGGAVLGTGVEDVVVEHCDFRWIGADALRLSGRSCRVLASRFEDVGGHGVVLSGGDRASLASSEHEVSDCLFARTGRVLRTYHPAVRLDGVGARVARNEFRELPHFALMAAGVDHAIEANHIHHVVQETGDAGALYFGRDWTTQGNIIRGNIFHDIEGSDARYQNAVYLDDMASGIVVERNLHVRCNWGALVGGGRDNILLDNAYVGCGQALVYDARGTGWMASAIADPGSSTILARYAATPVESEPWRTRFPALRDYLVDRRGRPVGGRVEGMILWGGAAGRIEDRECVVEMGTRRVAAPIPPRGGADGLDAWLAQAVRAGARLEGVLFGPAGPVRDPGVAHWSPLPYD